MKWLLYFLKLPPANNFWFERSENMINLSNYRLSRFTITTHDQYGNLLATHAISNRFYRIRCPSSDQNVCPELTMDLISQMQPNDIEQMIEGRIITDQDEFSDDTINDLYETAVTHNKRLDIVILTTNQCNFSCVYCFQKRETYTLNFKQYDALILFIENKIKQYNYRDVKIRWFGGEPLLGLQGIQYFSEKLNELKKKYKFTYGCGIITNGYLLDLKTFKELCDLVHVYDVHEKGMINKSTSSFSHRKAHSKPYTIQLFEEIVADQDSFDTLVVGHLGEVNQMTKHNYTKACIDFCLDYGKTMISFDTIPEIILREFQKRNLNCYNMNVEHISYDPSGKLRMIGAPIVSVIGTSSKLGKFSLQLELRKKLMEHGYAVGQWATEPQGYLFGIDRVFPSGYGSNLNFTEKEVLQFVNHQLYEIEKMGKDIILTGLQSYVLSEKLYNSRMYPFLQNALLAALQPDTLVLVASASDSNEFILRTINYIEALTEVRTSCIVLSPRRMQATFSPLEQRSVLCSEEEQISRIREIASITKRNVWKMEQTDEIVDSIIDELCEEQ